MPREKQPTFDGRIRKVLRAANRGRVVAPAHGEPLALLRASKIHALLNAGTGIVYSFAGAATFAASTTLTHSLNFHVAPSMFATSAIRDNGMSNTPRRP